MEILVANEQCTRINGAMCRSFMIVRASSRFLDAGNKTFIKIFYKCHFGVVPKSPWTNLGKVSTRGEKEPSKVGTPDSSR